MSKLFLAPLLLLAGCGEPASKQPAPTPTETGYIARVKALAPGQRDAVLFRAIRSGGGTGCQSVEKVEDMPPGRDGQPTWRATCSDGSEWSVALSDDGTALVTGARTS